MLRQRNRSPERNPNRIQNRPPVNVVNNGGMKYEKIPTYSEVECAYYYHDGQKDEVDINDPRLTRLLNLIVKSREDGTHAYQTGYIQKAEIQQCYGTSDTMVEVVFSEAVSK